MPHSWTIEIQIVSVCDSAPTSQVAVALVNSIMIYHYATFVVPVQILEFEWILRTINFPLHFPHIEK
jgi:hypothetical protein